MDLKKYVRDIVDFPKKGIVFKDITPLLLDANSFESCSQQLLSLVKEPIDKVVCIDARGFFFGGILAKELKAGFIPVRKKGKLPSDTIEESYSLEYGEDVLQIHKDAIQPGDKVLLHDDVLATGGTAEAVCKLIKRLGGEVVQCNFIITLDFLDGAKKLNAPVKSVISY